MEILSSAFEPGGKIPARYTGEGENVSPPLAWKGVPAGTQELALICDDPDAPTAEPWVHWVVWGIAPSKAGLAEGDAGGGTQGRTNFGSAVYGGPMPPRGHGVHHYHFKLYALSAPVSLTAGSTKKALLAEMKGKILAEAEMVGIYERR